LVVISAEVLLQVTPHVLKFAKSEGFFCCVSCKSEYEVNLLWNYAYFTVFYPYTQLDVSDHLTNRKLKSTHLWMEKKSIHNFRFTHIDIIFCCCFDCY